MAGIKDKVKKALSEVRTLVLGAQILLGFQYQAVFRPRFEDLPRHAKLLEAGTFAMLLVTIGCLIAPAAFHRISEGGEATRRQHAYTKAMMTTALVPFATAIGANIVIATGSYLGTLNAALVGLVTATVAGFFWYGLGSMKAKERDSPASGDERYETVPIGEKINELLLEARIVLPGVQALLGFQLAAYLTETFEKLPSEAKAVHTVSLLLIALAMILLMTPAPYHRLAENGENTEAFNRLGTGLVLAALVPLALGLAGEFYVVLGKVLQSSTQAWIGAGAALAAALILWFGVPLLARRRTRATG
jgi:hypothetical protein